MENLLQEIERVCFDSPSAAVFSYASQFFNETTFENRSIELSIYACAYHRLISILDLVHFWSAVLNVIFCVVGCSSAVFALLTLSQVEYKAKISFSYHRLINFVELICVGFLACDAANALAGPFLMRFSAWARWNEYVVSKFRNGLVVWVNFIVLWLTVERASACLAPKIFKLINKTSMATTACLITCVIAFCVMLPDGFYHYHVWNAVAEIYELKVSRFGQSIFYDLYVKISVGVLVFSAISLSAANVAAVLGYWSFAQKRKKGLLSKRASSYLNSRDKKSSRLISNQYADTQLCMLQLCEALPLVLNQLIYSAIKTINPLPFDAVNSQLYSAPSRLTFDQSIIDLERSIILIYLSLPNNFTANLAHCCHFYWYIAFCPKYRRSFIRLIRKTKLITKIMKAKENNSQDL